jgi:hypothetical protein
MSMPKPPRLPHLALALLIALGVAADLPGADLDLGVTDADLEPSVTVREREGARVEEYRVNNRLYRIRITPSIGAPYYLVDEDGSGDMAWHRGASQFEANIPQWVLLSW